MNKNAEQISAQERLSLFSSYREQTATNKHSVNLPAEPMTCVGSDAK